MKYGILNPGTGQYEFTEDETQIELIKNRIMREFYLHHTHNQPVIAVEDHEDGTVEIKSYSSNISLV